MIVVTTHVAKVNPEVMQQVFIWELLWGGSREMGNIVIGQ
jgi:hypothetical protein